MDQTRESSRHRSLMVGIGLVLTGLFVVALLGQNAWSHQAELTRSFEQCMDRAPFKTSLHVPQPEIVLSAEELQYHFDEFDRIFKATGLPAIWNGKSLVPWTVFHKDSIKFAQQCHEQLGIELPQKQLKGTYAKPVWNPNSTIWRPSR